jgi:hypothetical protein
VSASLRQKAAPRNIGAMTMLLRGKKHEHVTGGSQHEAAYWGSDANSGRAVGSV